MPWVDGQIEMTGAAGGVGHGVYSFEKIVSGAIEGGYDELAGAIYEEMEEVKVKSQEIVPYRDGTLRASADAVGVNLVKHGFNGLVAIGYGGMASAYSVAQHQTPPPGEAEEGEGGKKGKTFRHAEGRTWKYLERPMLAAAEGMEGRLAARVAARMRAR